MLESLSLGKAFLLGKLRKSLTPSEYVLKRDYLGSSRLNLSFFLWKDLLRFNLHPDISEGLGPNARIADVATGTGIWMLDLSREVPSTTTIHGFDIDLSQCPPPSSFPPNVKITKWDMFTPPPAELVGTFDVVHLRLVTLVIKNNDPTALLTNVAQLLKPDGYLQWDEIDAAGLHIESPENVDFEAVSKLFRATKIPKGTRGRDDWQWNLGSYFSNLGFAKSDLHTFKYEGAAARYWHDMYMVAWEEFMTRIMGSLKQSREMINNAVDESQKGVHVMYPKLVWVAKKQAAP
ncbi:S-adenosyl-L-methionine-dependent methyltransferase [Karstenula rhodostoma CBS 690.94]|uniref:S-adenosyl-L-methionine-dependent methyltransferase n=1 Tax=Karstenula rhodostoma CBS 690.94 TaxID=1392251 RepID=A0A9P4P8B2_9PLEO|nr:S-adenosyl-L-methionine-dependent methyltransferase [Karstenula rhodostoma CBS 690.94]